MRTTQNNPVLSLLCVLTFFFLFHIFFFPMIIHHSYSVQQNAKVKTIPCQIMVFIQYFLLLLLYVVHSAFCDRHKQLSLSTRFKTIEMLLSNREKEKKKKGNEKMLNGEKYRKSLTPLKLIVFY